MDNKANESNNSLDLNAFIDHVCIHMDAIRQQKEEDIFRIFINARNFFPLFEKIKNKDIITKEEHEKLKQFEHIADYVDPGTADLEKCIAEINTCIERYPYVLDVSHLHEYNGGKDNLFTTYKQGKSGMIQKILNKNEDGYTIHVITDPILWDEEIRLVDESCGLVRSRIHGKIQLSQLLKDKEGTISLIHIRHVPYDSIGDFDADGIAAVVKGTQAGLIQKEVITDNIVKIQEILAPVFKGENDNILRNGFMFDQYNTCESFLPGKNKVFLKKKFKNGKCIGVDVFKKSLFGKDTKVEV